FFHVERDRHGALLGRAHVGVDLVEEAHAVDRLHVAVEELLGERLAHLGPELDANRILLDAHVALDGHAGDLRLALRAQDARRAEDDQQRAGGERRPAETPSHAPVPPHPPRRATSEGVTSWSRPSARRSVLPIDAASSALCVAITSAEPCSWFSSSRS